MRVKNRFVGVHLLPEEHEALEAIGSQQRMNRSETLRWLIRRVAEELGFWPPKEVRHE